MLQITERLFVDRKYVHRKLKNGIVIFNYLYFHMQIKPFHKALTKPLDFSLEFLLDKKLKENSNRLATHAQLCSSLRSHVEKKIERKTESFGEGQMLIIEAHS